VAEELSLGCIHIEKPLKGILRLPSHLVNFQTVYQHGEIHIARTYLQGRKTAINPRGKREPNVGELSPVFHPPGPNFRPLRIVGDRRHERCLYLF
jgi:hypothetical protein